MLAHSKRMNRAKGHLFLPVFQPAVTGNGLLNALIACWPFNEASGNALDLHSNAQTLTQSSSPSSTTGLVYPTARLFVLASHQYFYRNDNAYLSVGDTDFTFAFWFFPQDFVTYRSYLSKYANTAGYREFILFYNSPNLLWKVYDGTAEIGVVSIAPPSTNAWSLVIVHHDALNNQVGIQVNNGTVSTSATTGAPGDTTQRLEIAACNSYGFYFDGRMGPVAFWKSAAGGGGVLSTSQRTFLYNGGSGLPYSEFS